MSVVLQCSACGGAVVYDAKAEQANCLFCGSVKLQPKEDEEVPIPHSMIPQAIDSDVARKQYEEWATSSWWYPKELRTLQVKLRAMYLPAWHFEGDVETHWAGLVSAITNSGKRPVSGSETRHLDHVLPASQGLTEEELDELLPFDTNVAEAWVPEEIETPYEVPGMTEQRARQEMHDIMRNMHRSLISAENSLLECTATAMVIDQNVTLYMLPIFIGAFRFRERPWRFIVNSQTGEVVGKAPIDRVKVALVSAGAALAIIAAYIAATM